MTETERVEQERVLKHWEAEEDQTWGMYSVPASAHELATNRFLAGDNSAYEDMLHAAVKMGKGAEKVLAAREKARQAREVLVPTMRLEDKSGEQWTTL